MKRFSFTLLCIVIAAFLCACNKDETPPAPTTASSEAHPAGVPINILYCKWHPADALQELGNRYQKQTGVEVKVDQKPWATINDTKTAEFSNNSNTYDLIIGDSQWLGEGAANGHYENISEMVQSHPEIFGDMAPAAMENYCEYPKGSKHYFAIPCESDAMAIAYRKDLFEDPKHKDQFKHYLDSNGQPPFDLGIPQTWNQLLWIAKYFHDENASGLHNMAGIVMPTARSYDQATMSYEPLLWSFGGDWGDQKALTCTIDSPESVAALQFMKLLVANSSEGGKRMDYPDVAAAYTSGRAAMAMTFFAFFPTFSSSTENPDYAAKTAYFNCPAGPAGKAFTALGGQGMSLNNHISDPRKLQAKAFMKWFSKTENQTQWVQLGGFTANTKLLQSDQFRNASPYNPLFADAFNMMKDFWSIPEYSPLLESSQKEITAVLQDNADPAQAVKNMQATQEAILKEAGSAAATRK